jgi:hypothetical protein
MVRSSVRAAAVLASAVAVLATGAASAGARPAVPVHSSTLHPVSAPSVTRPGLVHLRNTGSHELYLLRKIHASSATLVKDLNASSVSGSPTRLLRQFRLVDIINGRSDVYVHLSRGTYYLADATAEHYHASDIHPITVQGSRDDARVPHSRALTVNSRNVLIAPHTIRGGAFVHLRNADRRVQQLLYFQISGRATTQAIDDFLARPSFDKLFGLGFVDIGNIGVLSGHQNLYVRFPSHSGRYIVLTAPVTASGVGAGLRADRVGLVTAH